MYHVHWGVLILRVLDCIVTISLGVPCTVVLVTFYVMCGCFGNMCTCVYCVLYFFVYVCLLKGLLPPSDN
jgi:hypothetical protein